VECQNITFLCQGVQIRKTFFSAVSTGRVIEQSSHTQPFTQVLDAASYMAYSYNAQASLVQTDSFFLLEQEQNRMEILFYGSGIASGAVTPGNTGFPAVLRINMVETDGCRTDEPYPAAFQQLPVAVGSCTDDQCICIFYNVGSKVMSRQIDHFVCQARKSFAYIRDFVVYNYFHLYSFLFLG